MDKPFIQALRRSFASAADTYGMRLGGQMFGDQYWKMPSSIAFVEVGLPR